MFFQDIRTCPNCGIRISKSRGCSQIRCPRCSLDYCWCCMHAMHHHASIFNVCPKLQYSRVPNLLLTVLFIFSLPVLEVVGPPVCAIAYSAYALPRRVLDQGQYSPLAFLKALLCVLILLPLSLALAVLLSAALLVFATLPL